MHNTYTYYVYIYMNAAGANAQMFLNEYYDNTEGGNWLSGMTGKTTFGLSLDG